MVMDKPRLLSEMFFVLMMIFEEGGEGSWVHALSLFGIKNFDGI